MSIDLNCSTTDVMDVCWNKKNLKLRDFLPRQTQDSDQECHYDGSDLEFVYADTDTYTNEIAELYSYSEQPEFQLNVKAFEDYMDSLNLRPAWQYLTMSQKCNIITILQGNLDVLDKTSRMKAARCVLYLAQGCWAECQSDAEQQVCTKENILLLYKCGIFSSFIELFLIEINMCSVTAIQRKVSVTVSDSVDLRVIMSVMYIFVEVIRNVTDDEETEYVKLREEFREEVSNPCCEDELLMARLFGMLTRYCSGTAPHYPIKKVVLLLWKLILLTLGGSDKLKAFKLQKRAEAGLKLFEEDTIQIVRTMRASTPPIGSLDCLAGSQKKARPSSQLRRSLIKQSSLDESLCMDFPIDEDDYEEQQQINTDGNGEQPEQTATNAVTIPSRVPSAEETVAMPQPVTKGLPWMPKIRQKDLDAFLDSVRLKFVGFTLPNDRDTLVGLPKPVHEGIEILKRYVYTSLGDLQVEREENILKYPMSQAESEIPLTSTELLYQAMLPNMQQNIIALLKVLLAGSPTAKTKGDSINIVNDVLPEVMPMTVLQSMNLGIDVARHKEIIVKAVSAILLLLLKHFKLNHIYQFEFLSQYLVFANSIPLVLKFFNQNIINYVGTKSVIPILEFPACVIGDQPELTSESLEIGDSQQQCCWRNVFSCINLLRILNKITKWKHSRIMMLVVFKSAPILRRTLKVRHAMMQLYVLKLLKMQTKYLGRQWRKSNMKTMSAIYQKVRHRLNDDWAYGNDLDARPWDFQAEECSLRSAVDKFNTRRYSGQNTDPDYCPISTYVVEALATEIELTDDFKQHYHLWLQQEVFEKSIDWDQLAKMI